MAEISSPICVTLTSTELAFAAMVASVRRETARADQLKASNPPKAIPVPSDWYTDFIGACAEQAYAKWRGVYWHPSNRTFKAADVGDVQVRGTHHSDGHLIIRPNDEKPEERFVLGVVLRSQCKLRGWLICHEAKQEVYWRQDAWWVPQEALRPMGYFQ